MISLLHVLSNLGLSTSLLLPRSQISLGDLALDLDERLLAALIAAFRPSSPSAPAPSQSPTTGQGCLSGASPGPTPYENSNPGSLGALDLAAVAGTDPAAGGG